MEFTNGVIQFKEYIKNLPKNSPYKFLAKYEQQLLDTGKQTRALVRICNSDQHKLINNLEALTWANWFRVSNFTSIDHIPDNYFNVVLWSDCDIETELRQVIKIFPKLRAGARLYFNNLVQDFGNVLSKCLDSTELETFIGKGSKLTSIFKNTVLYAQLIRSILEEILKDYYYVKLLDYKDQHFVVLIRKSIVFVPDPELSAVLAGVDAKIGKKFPPIAQLKLSAKQIEKIRNRVFEIIIDDPDIDPDDLCEQLVDENILPDCKAIGGHRKYLTDRHLQDVNDAIDVVKDEINQRISFGISDVDKLLLELVSPDEKLADKDAWEKFTREYAESKLGLEWVEDDEGDYESDYESDVGDDDDDEEEYPEIPEPPLLLPAVLLPGLSNIGNSCFIDSVLFPIFIRKDGYFDHNILQKKLTIQNVRACSEFSDDPEAGLEYLTDFQNELRKMVAIMRGIEEPELTCHPIFQRMAKCSKDPAKQALFNYNQGDESEFLGMLMDMFHLYPTRIAETIELSNDNKNWVPFRHVEERQRLLEMEPVYKGKEPPELVEWYQKIEVEQLSAGNWITGADGKKYQFQRTRHTIVGDAAALLFHIKRLQIVGTATGFGYLKNTSVFRFNEYIQHETTGQYYELQAVTIHSGGEKHVVKRIGGHWTAFFKYAGNWFLFNDSAPPNKRVRASNWKEVIGRASTNGSMFMYFPIG